jgi:hypothetical protein
MDNSITDKEPLTRESVNSGSAETLDKSVITFGKAIRTATDIDRFVYVHRASSRNNAHTRTSRKKVFEKYHLALRPNEDFVFHSYIGSGKAEILKNAFNSRDPKRILAGTYFAKLMDIVQSKLSSMPAGRLYVTFSSIDRIFRSTKYSAKEGGTKTWNYDDKDYALFQKFLDFGLGQDKDRVSFVTMCEGTSQIRSQQTKVGMEVAGNTGGRPSVIQRQYRIKPLLKPEAVGLAKNGWNARNTVVYFENKRKISDRTVRGWLREDGASSPRGRPKGSKKRKAEHSKFNQQCNENSE